MLDSPEQQIRAAERLTIATARIAIERALAELRYISAEGRRSLPMLDRAKYEAGLAAVESAADHLDGRS